MTPEEYEDLFQQTNIGKKRTPASRLGDIHYGFSVFLGYRGKKTILEHGFMYVVADGPTKLPSTVLCGLMNSGWRWTPMYQAWQLEL